MQLRLSLRRMCGARPNQAPADLGPPLLELGPGRLRPELVGASEISDKGTFLPWFHTTAREPKRAHSEGPGLEHQNSTTRPPEREKKMKTAAGEGKKKRNVGRSGGGRSSGGRKSGPAGGRSRERAVPREGGPARGRSRTTQTTPPHTIWIFTPRKSGPHTTHTNTHQHTPTHTQHTHNRHTPQHHTHHTHHTQTHTRTHNSDLGCLGWPA